MTNGLLHSNTVSLEVLSMITVKISCYNHTYGEVIGTGTIFKDKGCFFVLTAAHCLAVKEKDYKFLNEEIKIESIWGDTSTTYNILERIAEDFDEKKDFAILKISAPTACRFDFDLDLLMIREFSKKIPATTYGYSKGSGHKGRSYDLELIASQKWSVKDSIKEKGEDPCDVISGLSGGGLFIKDNGKYLCIGYIKGIDEQNNTLQDITVFPMSHFKYNWTNNWYNCLEEAEGKMSESGQMTEQIASNSKLTNEAKINYESHWTDLYTAIYNKKDTSYLIESIEDGKNSYPLSKNTRTQDMLIDYLYRKSDNWTEDEQQSFLMALRDRGLWPSLYGKQPNQAAGIENKPLFKSLERRGETILHPEPCTMTQFAAHDDDNLKYEDILRAAFSFDFELMYTMVKLWEPSGQWIINKAILINILEKDNTTCQHLRHYIESGNPDAEIKYLAIQAYNLIDFKFPSEYKYIEYHKAGLDSFVNTANSIIDNIDKKQEKIKPYGVQYMYILGDNEDVTSFPESLHLLSLLIETGFIPNRLNIGVITSERWYKVCRQLINTCPLPILFYTLQYQDNKLLKKVGQCLAYRYDEQNPSLLSILLKTLLNALASKYLPSNMYSSIYLLTCELYIAVNEEEWFSLFYNNILTNLYNSDNFYRFTISDEIIQNIKAAILCLKSKKHKQEIFKLLLRCFVRNKTMVNYLINDVLIIPQNFFDSDDLKQIKDKFINDTSLYDGYCIFYKLLKSDNLEDKDLIAINQKAQQESMDFTKTNLYALGMLMELITNNKTINELKKTLLSQDMWHCGIQKESSTFSLPNSLHLEKFSTNITWNKKEWNIIINNMYDNLSLINLEKTKYLLDNYFSTEYLNLIYEMKYFLYVQKAAHKIEEPDLEKLLDLTLAEKRNYTQLYEALISDNYKILSEGCGHLCTLVKTQGIKGFEDEIDLIINRVLLKRKEAFTSCLKSVYHLLLNYKEEMIDKYGSKLIRLLHSMINYDFEELDVNVPHINFLLNKIANTMKTYYGSNCSINYWLNDEIVNRFNYNQ